MQILARRRKVGTGLGTILELGCVIKKYLNVIKRPDPFKESRALEQPSPRTAHTVNLGFRPRKCKKS